MTSPVTPPAAPVVPLYPPLGSATFNADAYAYGSAMPGVVDGINDLADNAHTNALSSVESANAAAVSASAATIMTNFKGLWSSLSGSLVRPATVLDNGAYWVLLQDLPDVAAVRPGTDAAVWSPQILEARAIGAVDLNLIINTGSYTVSGAFTNGPPGVTSAIVNVTHAGDVAVQLLHDTIAGASWVRMASALTTLPAWTAWGRITQDNTAPVALAGGAIDCSKGTYFTETVSANRTLAFANVPTGAYAGVLEIYHTGGTITLPAGSVWVSATAPTLNTSRRHLLFFQRAITGSGGWIFSALPNSAL